MGFPSDPFNRAIKGAKKHQETRKTAFKEPKESLQMMSHQIENSDEETPVVNRLLKTLQWKLGSQTIRSLKSKVINIPHENLLTSCCFASRSTS